MLTAPLVLSIFLTTSLALREIRQSTPNNFSTSSFVQSTPDGTISFAVTAVQQTGDLYFHLEAPAKNGWVSVGTGSKMRYSTMWMVYRSANGTGVTFSSRTANNHVEPLYAPNIPCQLDDESGVSTSGVEIHEEQQLFVVNAVCRGINNRDVRALTKRSLYDSHSIERRKNKGPGDGKISFDNEAQAFMFASGPTDRTIESDSKTANIRRHSVYGTFTLNLKAATVQSPSDFDKSALSAVGTWTSNNSRLTSGPKQDTDVTLIVHMVLLCGSFVLLFPTGVVFLRILDKVRWHAYIQGAGAVLIIVGVGLGLGVSGQYVHSQSISSGHQVIGLIAGALTVIQLGLGVRNHLIFKRTLMPTVYGRIHRYLGPVVLFVGTVNGFLGFVFSGKGGHNVLYGLLSGAIFIGLTGLLFWNAKKKAKTTKGTIASGTELRRFSSSA